MKKNRGITSKLRKTCEYPFARLLILVFVFCTVVLSISFTFSDSGGREELGLEFGKAAINFIFTVVIGAIFYKLVEAFEKRRSELAEAVEKRRNKWVARREFLFDHLTEGLAELYSRAKKVRRSLRAQSIDKNLRDPNYKYGRKMNVSLYKESLQELNDVEVKLERYKSEAEFGKKLGLLDESVENNIEKMAEYLNKLIKEFEYKLPSNQEVFDISEGEFPELRDFIRKAKIKSSTSESEPSKSKFKSEFSESYYAALNSIRDELFKDLLPESQIASTSKNIIPIENSNEN